MLFKFKILSSQKESKILGMFGDCIKVRINLNSDFDLLTKFKAFLAQELANSESIIEIKKFDDRKNILIVELPDEAYEILMSLVD